VKRLSAPGQTTAARSQVNPSPFWGGAALMLRDMKKAHLLRWAFLAWKGG